MLFRRIQILRITAIYLSFGFAWILLTDLILDRWASNWELASRYQSFKGIFFVFLSGLVIAGLLWQESKAKTVLLAEIHHRVKNNLAIISAFLELQTQHWLKDKDSISPEHLLINSVRRIKTMAISHEILYSLGDLHQLQVKVLLEKLWNNAITLEPNFPLRDKIRFQPEVLEDELDLSQGIPLALILNELFSNSLQYAFPDGDLANPPQIHVFFGLEAGSYLFRYKDNGIGLEDKNVFYRETKNGLGFFILKALTKQLQGEIIIQTREGLEFFLKFPKR